MLSWKSEAPSLPSSNGGRPRVIWGQKIVKSINPDNPISYLRVLLLLHKGLTFHRNPFLGRLLLKISKSRTQSSAFLPSALKKLDSIWGLLKMPSWLPQLAFNCWLNTLCLSLSNSKASIVPSNSRSIPLSLEWLIPQYLSQSCYIVQTICSLLLTTHPRSR